MCQECIQVCMHVPKQQQQQQEVKKAHHPSSILYKKRKLCASHFFLLAILQSSTVFASKESRRFLQSTTMKFQARFAKAKEFQKIAQVLEKVNKSCVIKLSKANCALITDTDVADDTQVWVMF
eukprot:GEZU01014111.1.p1 GENE.GEZU01014111.1~~GEZU01014111.1.p1  ORF type:complete len:123 (+),score=15.20 GEZU01014111.1:100-468(+)